MKSSIKFSEKVWNIIYQQISKEYPHSVLLLRYKCKEVLGFTVRRHTDWKDSKPFTYIVLDFYDLAKQTMFLLKYSELLDKNKLT